MLATSTFEPVWVTREQIGQPDKDFPQVQLMRIQASCILSSLECKYGMWRPVKKIPPEVAKRLPILLFLVTKSFRQIYKLLVKYRFVGRL